VSPVVTVFVEASAAENRKLPAVVLSHTEMCESTSPEVPAHEVHDKVPDIAFAAADAAAQVIANLVVTDEGVVVPAAPGSPMCNFTAVVAGAVNAVPPSMSSHLFDRLASLNPTAMS
jgi:hypothetical protein